MKQRVSGSRLHSVSCLRTICEHFVYTWVQPSWLVQSNVMTRTCDIVPGHSKGCDCYDFLDNSNIEYAYRSLLGVSCDHAEEVTVGWYQTVLGPSVLDIWTFMVCVWLNFMGEVWGVASSWVFKLHCFVCVGINFKMHWSSHEWISLVWGKRKM